MSWPRVYARVTRTDDERGKVSRTTYYGIFGEPVLDKDGHHGSLVEYDERGNQIAETFIDLDGKPLP